MRIPQIWGTTRMRQQWFPGRFSYGLGTRLRRGIPSLPNDRQQHSALPKTKPLPLVGARTDSTHHALLLQREAWPIPAHAHWHSLQDPARRGFCILVLFIHICKCCSKIVAGFVLHF